MVATRLTIRRFAFELTGLVLLNAVLWSADSRVPSFFAEPFASAGHSALAASGRGAAHTGASAALAALPIDLEPLRELLRAALGLFGRAPAELPQPAQGSTPVPGHDAAALSAIAEAPAAALSAAGSVRSSQRPQNQRSPILLRQLDRHPEPAALALPARRPKRTAPLQLAELSRELARTWGVGGGAAAGVCSADATAAGETDGRAGLPLADPAVRYGACSAADRARRGREYEDAYHGALRRLCAAAIPQEARRAAQLATEPSELAERCLAEQPEARERYQRAFEDARGLVVSGRCTFEAGLAAGRADAGTRAERDTEQPPFCNGSSYPLFLTGYVEGWRDGKEAACDGRKAYDEGLSKGRSGNKAAYKPPAHCAGTYADRMLLRYDDGFRTGALLRRRARGGSLRPRAQSSPPAARLRRSAAR